MKNKTGENLLMKSLILLIFDEIPPAQFHHRILWSSSSGFFLWSLFPCFEEGWPVEWYEPVCWRLVFVICNRISDGFCNCFPSLDESVCPLPVLMFLWVDASPWSFLLEVHLFVLPGDFGTESTLHSVFSLFPTLCVLGMLVKPLPESTSALLVASSGSSSSFSRLIV